MKKLIAVTLSLILTVSCLAGLSLTTSAAWDGSYSVDYTGGTGTEADPYLISSEQDLALLAQKTSVEGLDYAGCYFKLTMDLDLGGVNWTPIANYENKIAFQGSFDGDGHTISGLTCQTENNYGGLFGRLQSATVKNLTVIGTSVTSAKYAGGIAAFAYKGCEIYNCHTAIDNMDSTVVGGIIGRAEGLSEAGTFGSIKGCTSASNVKITLADNKNIFVGGIIGAAGAMDVSWCINTGNLESTVSATTLLCVGGIVGVQGASNNATNVYNCYNTGKVSAVSTIDEGYAGGLIGRAAHVTEAPNIENSFNVGSAIVVDENNAPKDGKYGSLIGHIRQVAFISNCYTSVSYTEYPEVGTDAYESVEAGNITVLTEAQMKGPDAVANMKLGAGWVSEAAGLPTIDLANATDGSTAPDEDDTTTETPDTTPAPTETTVPDGGDEQTTPEDTTTAAPTTTPTEQSTTTAPAGGDNSSDDNGGSNVFVILIIVVVVLAAGAIAVVVVMDKKKKA